MARCSGSPIAACVLPDPPPNAPRTTRYSRFGLEVLDSLGLFYRQVSFTRLQSSLRTVRVLITFGNTAFREPLAACIADWIARGGRWIAVGGDCGCAQAFGAKAVAPDWTGWGGGLAMLGEGYLVPASGAPLHVFGGACVSRSDGTVAATMLDAHRRKVRYPGIVSRSVGAGCATLVAPDIVGSIVHIRQGRAITRDGVPAPDGSAPLADGVLKSGDGAVLDWHFDRTAVPGTRLHIYANPIADRLADLLMTLILDAARACGCGAHVLWFHPFGARASGHISHDTDGNDAASAVSLLRVLEAAGIASTWCVILPGYSRALIRQIRDSGHELAMHYDAMSGGCRWSRREFDRQAASLAHLLRNPPTTNKNHYLRWEGDTEFLTWCRRRGITLDQSRGASKTGEAGFNFGASRPYRCVSPDGHTIDVLELPTPTQDLEVFAPRAVLPMLMGAVLETAGVLHLLFHPAHIEKSGVAEALKDAVASGRAAGLVWRTAAQIDQFERGRLSARGAVGTRGGRPALSVRSQAPMAGATILSLQPPGMGTFRHWGHGFDASTHTITPEPATDILEQPRP